MASCKRRERFSESASQPRCAASSFTFDIAGRLHARLIRDARVVPWTGPRFTRTVMNASPTRLPPGRNRCAAPLRPPLAWQVVRRTANGFGHDELSTRAAALAFYSALSFAPLLVLLLWVVTSLQPAWQQELTDSLQNLVGPRAAGGGHAGAGQRPRASRRGQLGRPDRPGGHPGRRLGGVRPAAGRDQPRVEPADRGRAAPSRTGCARACMALGLLLSLAFLMVISFAASALIAIFVRGDTPGSGRRSRR